MLLNNENEYLKTELSQRPDFSHCVIKDTPYIIDDNSNGSHDDRGTNTAGMVHGTKEVEKAFIKIHDHTTSDKYERHSKQ